MGEDLAATAPIFYYIFQGNRNITVALVKNLKTVRLYNQTKNLLHYSEVFPTETGAIHVSVSAPDQENVEIHTPDWTVLVPRMCQMKSQNFLVKGSSEEAVLKFKINEEEHDLSVKFTGLAKTKSVPNGMEFGDYANTARKRHSEGSDTPTLIKRKVSRREGQYDVHVEGSIQNLNIACESSNRCSLGSESEDPDEGIGSRNITPASGAESDKRFSYGFQNQSSQNLNSYSDTPVPPSEKFDPDSPCGNSNPTLTPNSSHLTNPPPRQDQKAPTTSPDSDPPVIKY